MQIYIQIYFTETYIYIFWSKHIYIYIYLNPKLYVLIHIHIFFEQHATHIHIYSYLTLNPKVKTLTLGLSPRVETPKRWVKP